MGESVAEIYDRFQAIKDSPKNRESRIGLLTPTALFNAATIWSMPHPKLINARLVRIHAISVRSAAARLRFLASSVLGLKG